MPLLSVPLAILISLCWYYPGIKAQGENRVLKKKDYWWTALIIGFFFSSLLIMITEVIWDILVDATPLDGLAKELIADFFRAALLEEIFKFTGFILAKNVLKLYRKIDYMMIAGLIGLVYGVFEKIVIGNIMAVIVGLLLPMHIIWQFNQGGHYFEYEKAVAANNKKLAHKELFMAIMVPFLLHGCWDGGISLGTYFLEMENSTAAAVFGAVLIIALFVGYSIYTIKTIKKVIKTAKES